MRSEPDDSENSLNRQSERKYSIEKLKSQLKLDRMSQNPRQDQTEPTRRGLVLSLNQTSTGFGLDAR